MQEERVRRKDVASAWQPDSAGSIGFTKDNLKSVGGLSKQAKQQIGDILDFYRSVSIPSHMTRAKTVASILADSPHVVEVYGTGYPNYGRADISRRIEAEVKKFEAGDKTEKQLLQKILPDLDFLLIYRTPDRGPWRVSEGMEETFRENYGYQQRYYRRQWDDIAKKLDDGTNTRIYGLYDHADPVNDFLKEGRLHVDIRPVPENVWREVPNFVEPGDRRYFEFLEDMMFTAYPISKKTSDVPSKFRQNYLLNVLRKNPLASDALLDHVLENQPYSELIKRYPETRRILRRRWEAQLKSLVKGGFVAVSDGNATLTEKGSRRLESVLEMRRMILDRGFDVDLAESYGMFERPIVEAALKLGVSPEKLVKKAKKIIVKDGMTIVVTEGEDMMSDLAADVSESQLKAKKKSVFGLATGGTQEQTYANIVRRQLDWSGVTTFNLDEYRGLDPKNPNSYHHYMDEHLFGTPEKPKININRNNIFIPDGTARDVEEFCVWYEEQIKNKGGIDLQLLGVGKDGHIGFNEPPSRYGDPTRLVSLNPQTIQDNARFFLREGETVVGGRIMKDGVNITDEAMSRVPKDAITMGVSTIMNSRRCMLLAKDDKADIMPKVIEESPNGNVSASYLQWHSNAIFILTERAASKLTLKPVWER